jgi:hypothetical protein
MNLYNPSSAKKKKGAGAPTVVASADKKAPTPVVAPRSAAGQGGIGGGGAGGPSGIPPPFKFAGASFLNSPDPGHVPVPDFDFDADLSTDAATSPVLPDRAGVTPLPPYPCPTPAAVGAPGAGDAEAGISSLRRLLKISS